MFKFFAIIFAAVLALTSAAPKPNIIAGAYGAPLVGALPAVSPVAYSAPFAYAAAPVAYSASYAAPLAYSAPVAAIW